MVENFIIYHQYLLKLSVGSMGSIPISAKPPAIPQTRPGASAEPQQSSPITPRSSKKTKFQIFVNIYGN